MHNIKVFTWVSVFSFLTACQTIGSHPGYDLAPVEIDVSSYRISCPPVIDNDAFKARGNNFTFKLDKGDVGGCPSDRKSYSDGYVSFDHSERQEITWQLPRGITTFAAKFRYDGSNEFRRNTIFQIHGGGAVPFWTGIKDTGSQYHINDGTVKKFISNRQRWVEGRTYEIKVVVLYNDMLSVKWFVDDDLRFFAEGLSFHLGDGPYGRALYIKIGQYRIAAEGTTVYLYSDVSITNEGLTEESEYDYLSNLPNNALPIRYFGINLD